MRKIISIALAAAMALSSMTAVFAKAPSEYDGKSYTSLGYTSDDTDEQINLAVIANGDVKFYAQNTMYIRGSVYSNGTIYAGNGGGNYVDGLLISGTGDTTYTSADGDTRTANGYIHVNSDTGLTDGITYYSTTPHIEGNIYDDDTSFGYSYDGFTVPGIDNKVDSIYGNQWGNAYGSTDTSAKTVAADTYYGTFNIGGQGLTIDASEKDITIVIDTLNITDGTPNIKVNGNHKVNLYINKISSYNTATSEVNLTLTNTTVNEWGTGASASEYDYLNEYDWATKDAETYFDAMGDPDQISLYLGETVTTLNGSHICANVYSNADSLTISGSTKIKGNVTTKATTLKTDGGGTYIEGTVMAPNAYTTVGGSSIVLGQVYTNTLVQNGAGQIVWKSDSINLGDDSEDEDDSNSSDSQYKLDIIEDVVYVVVGEDIPAFTLDKNVNYKWEISNSNVYFSSNSKGENIWNPGYLTADDVTFDYGHNSGWSSMSAGDEVTVKAVSYDDASLYDTAKIIFVASEEDIPKDTEEEPEDDPFVPDGDPIDLSSVRHAYIFGDEPKAWEDGETAEIYMAPERAVQLDEVCAMITRLIIQVNEDEVTGNLKELDENWYDSDTDSSWYGQGMQYLNGKGYFATGESSDPFSNPTREQVAKLIVFGLNLSGTDGAATFNDVSDDNAYKTYIDIMSSHGYMEGDNKGNFDPDKEMTRAEFCAMFNNITARNDYLLETAPGTDENGDEVAGKEVTTATYYIVDVDDGAWYYEDILRATSAFTKEGYVDLATRQANIRNISDNYEEGQKQY